MIQNVETKNADSVKHRFKLAQAVNWLLNIFKGLGESTNNQALVSDGNGSLAFEEVITTEGGQTIAGTLDLQGHLNFDNNLGVVWGGGTSRPYVIGNKSEGSVKLGAAGTEIMRLVGGNVGIGETNPQRPLHVDSKTNVNTSARFETNLASGSYITFVDANTTDELYVRLGSIGNDMVFNAGNSERMRIDSSGNVGIGTTNPSTKLEVTGTTTLANLDVTGTTKLTGLPTTDPVVAGQLWNDSGTLKISAG